MSNSKNVTVNFPIFGILGLIFITLKLTGHITWSWLWVLSPFWIPIAVALLTVLIVFLWALFSKN
jgi:hypothetical protein